jgi:cell shape-determining protein MreD
VIALAPLLSRAFGWTALAAVALAALAVELAPAGWAARPDLLFLPLAAVAARRPELVPPPLTFALALIRDLVSGAPAGAGAFGLTLGVELMRRSSAALARRGAVYEHAAATAAFAAALVAQTALIGLTFSAVAPLPELAARWAMTAALYPAAMLIAAWPLREAAR